MKFALFEHSQSNMGLVNIGDYVQSCAAAQFLPQVDFYVERDRLNATGIQPAKIIMNGWFTDAPQNWPPSDQLDPLFISFHLQPSSAAIILEKEENIAYFKKHEPIGCRDYKTVQLLEEKGIKAYFSFCLTTTLDIEYKSEEKSGEIIMVDPLYSYDFTLLKKMNFWEAITSVNLKKLKKLKDYLKPKSKITDFVPQKVLDQAIDIEHYVSSKKSNEELYELARTLLHRYAKAKLIITSRIHCALPAIAMGTPVLFVLKGLEDESLHMSRFRGILDHINILTTSPKEQLDELFGKEMNVYHPNDIDWDNPPQNPESYRTLSDELKKKVRAFVG